MTLIMRRSYGFSLQGIRAFAVNRFLRIYPTYWAVVLFSAIVVASFPAASARLKVGLSWPQTFQEWILNLGIIGHSPPSDVSRLIPPVWTLHVELIFYALIAIFFSRRNIYLGVWLTCSLIATIWLNNVSNSYDEFRNNCYFSLLSCSLPFSLGACLYLLYESNEDRKYKMTKARLLLVSLVTATTYMGGSLLFDSRPSYDLFRSLFYGQLLLSCIGVYTLSLAIPGDPNVKAIDKHFGDISYPLYLIHYPVGALVSGIASSYGVTLERGNRLLITSTVLSYLLSWLLIHIVHNPIETLRRRVKTANTAVPPDASNLHSQLSGTD